jgi:hypothetical protein
MVVPHGKVDEPLRDSKLSGHGVTGLLYANNLATGFPPSTILIGRPSGLMFS